MSQSEVRVSMFTTVKVPEDEPVVLYDAQREELDIWPQGVGTGPVISMPVDTWDDIAARVEKVLKRRG
ncbi:hypothetical protein SEA_TESLA_98 [Mycobacterium phage Tesla]|uniref:Uncharacterized protein n=9 Tax=Marvinvirus TaxID=1982091 RepID=A0A3S9U9B4_9CAUD|nr:hypothetical protein FH33_gp098 [Mycobacterium phage MosMoris]YP_009614214.1 hypothetical protein FDI61_gp096 [Mycobacterium phage Marvin]ANM46323.1 hypothetical protein SEA_GATTACA_101 [Mycobacterium phage Gattaca]AVE00844.1 hypothetical protein SEA_TESLA_98 [Mycobacterium phage Tesla]AZS06868.1 hypothetical protein SEA_RAELA_104 [Mycobacterium phage Raela]QAX93153.1 hypothetical protein SEA_REDRAIDER77_102 [Mycobacterium phage RedRaider77]QBQ71393.1 hypothetical protein SEA_BLACKBEETLE_1